MTRDQSPYPRRHPHSKALSLCRSPLLPQVAELSLAAPLPKGWTEEALEGGRIQWTHAQEGVTRDSHPLDPYFVELRNRRRRALAK